MVAKNNDVEVIRELYERHGLAYLKKYFKNTNVTEITIQGHRLPGKKVNDILIEFDSGAQSTVEIKGSQLININGKGRKAREKGYSTARMSRIKLTNKDYASTYPADMYLFVIDTSQLGDTLNLANCEICEDVCNYRFLLVDAGKVHDLVTDVTKPYFGLSFPRLIGAVIGGEN